MVNNAGIFLSKPFVETSPADLDRLHGVNVRGVFVGCQAAAADMRERDAPGAIVNTASISANLAQYDLSAYQTTKGAVRMITRGAALELAESGVRVNAVAPGAIATEFTEGLTEDTERGAREDEFIKPIPMREPGYPEDVAGAAVWLASPDAGYVTGELLHVDGGWQVV
jgi:NAD(P)-dependent dehydrogenase (short-subunit alcohol dehydrogenase family)